MASGHQALWVFVGALHLPLNDSTACVGIQHRGRPLKAYRSHLQLVLYAIQVSLLLLDLSPQSSTLVQCMLLGQTP